MPPSLRDVRLSVRSVRLEDGLGVSFWEENPQYL